ncbi:MAG: acetyl-CoA carboxylase biotin carboxyl carrier protein [Puniceicoccales bacterium]|nr:acetyl-CoA carboxylase biotin carboxyl carrier protein [Puniceicoccales bacterium]
MEKNDIRELINELIAVMEGANLSEIEIADGAMKIVLRKGAVPLPPVVPEMYAVQPRVSNFPVPSDVPVQTTPCDHFHVIKSPMVGTFYAAPSPESDPFVRVGLAVEKDQPICILEAMKVMNEIQSDVAGVVREILVKNGQPVEFGQPLFKVEIC